MSLHDPDYFQACDVRRLGHRPCFRQTDSLAARGLHEGVKCYGFFGSGDKNQSTTNTQIGASEDADLIYATGSNVAGQGGTLLQGSNVLGGVSLGGANSGSITINGNAGVKEATEQFAELLNNVSDGARETVTTALSEVSKLSESKQTEGISSLGRIALWGLGIVAVGVIGYAVLGRK